MRTHRLARSPVSCPWRPRGRRRNRRGRTFTSLLRFPITVCPLHFCGSLRRSSPPRRGGIHLGLPLWGPLPTVSTTCRVHHDFDDGGPDDHFPASVALSLAGLPEGEPTYEYPRIGLRTVEDVRAPFLAVCRDEACMPWTANVHQQVANFDQAFWHACGRRPSKPTAHRAYVNEDLWKLIRQRKVLLGQIRQAGLQQDRCC